MHALNDVRHNNKNWSSHFVAKQLYLESLNNVKPCQISQGQPSKKQHQQTTVLLVRHVDKAVSQC